MIKDLIVNPNSKSIISFEWMIIDKCNQKCSYCSSNEFNNNTLNNHDLYKIGLFKLGKLRQKFKVDIVGGEPTLHKNLTHVVETLTNLEWCDNIDICSNMRSTVELYKNLNQKKLTITASFHIEYEKGFKEKCLEVSKYTKLDVNINMYPEQKHWKTVENLILYCRNNNIKYGFNFLNETSEYSPNYTKEFFEFFDKYLKDEEKYIEHHYKDRVDILSESELFERNISYEGFLCTPKQFQIELNGDIINDCTHEKINFDLSGLLSEIKCPLKLCHNQIKYAYKKVSV